MEEKKEENIRICKLCRQLKKRIQDGKFNTKDKKWRDENGLLWNGSMCPQCNKDRIKVAMRSKRNVKVS